MKNIFEEIPENPFFSLDEQEKVQLSGNNSLQKKIIIKFCRHHFHQSRRRMERKGEEGEGREAEERGPRNNIMI